jgi:6-phospho-3-hexuloisomerase
MEEILKDLKAVLGAVPADRTEAFLDAIVNARRVFMYGLGRSGLVARAFGMRLVHLGRDATIVGDTTTPAIRADDLLVICSRTGRSPILRHAVDLGHREGARAVAVVGNADTALERAADLVVRLPIEEAADPARQPLGSLFEQALLLYLDATVTRLMQRLGITVEEMQEIHSNLP